jgi:hypothetical protein
MRKLAEIFILIFLALFGLVCLAHAICTKSGTVGATSTQIVAADDIRPRSYMLIENSGCQLPMWVAIGSNNNATVNDFYLAPGASWLLTPWPQANVPSGDVAVISQGAGTTYAFCDY